MVMKPMSTLSFNGEDAFEIKDSAAREALETLNTELDKSKREISEQIGVLERLQPETAMVGHILEVDSVDETGKPLTYRAVENKPDIEVDDTLTQEGMAADAKATGEALKNISVDETLTLEEYQALSEEEKNSNKTFYIKDADIIDIKNVAKTCAKHIAFDNTNTTLTSKEVQGALVEVDNKLANKADCIVAKASGETIVATDSDEQKPLGLAIDGKSEQNQYSGKNLLDLSGFTTKTNSGVTFTNNGDGSCNITGTCTDSNGNIWLAGGYNVDPVDSSKILFTLKSGKTYYIKNCMLFTMKNGTIATSSAGIRSFDEDFEVTGVRNEILVAGKTYNDTVVFPMVAESDVGIPWEPYCGGIPSPNPDFPQEIENVGVVRNLLENTCEFTEYKGVVINVNEDGSIYLKGKATANDTFHINSNINLADGNYIFSIGENLRIRVLGYQNGWIEIKKANTGGIAEFTADSNLYSTYMVQVGFTLDVTYDTTIYPMIRPASITDPTYHPYIPENKENLLDLSGFSTSTEAGVTVTKNADNTLSVTGTSTTNGGVFLMGDGFVGDNVCLTLKAGSYVFSGKSDDLLMIVYKAHTSSSKSISLKNGVFTIEEDVDLVSVSLRYESGKTFNISDLKLRLVKNHIPKHGSKYAVEVKSVGKNIFDMTKGVNNTSFHEGNGNVNAGGTSIRVLKIPILSGEALTASIVEGTEYLRISSLKADGTWIKREALLQASGKSTFTVSDEARFLEIAWNEDITKAMIEYGSVATDYEPYKESRTTIHLDEPLRGIGEYRDTICQKDGVWGVERYIGKVVLNGTEYWSHSGGWLNPSSFQSQDVVWNPLLISGYKTVSSMLCDNLVVKTPGNIADNVSEIGIAQGGDTGKIVYISIIDITTAEALKAHLSENPITVEYQLATPTFTPFEDQTIFDDLSMFYPTTILSNDCNANMEVEYVVDTKTYIAKLENKIVEQNQRLEQQISEQNKNFEELNKKGLYPLITTEQGGTITIPDITQYDLLIFYMDIDSADTNIGATQQFTFVVSHVINRYGKLYYTGKGGNGDTSGYIIFNSATSFTVLRTGDVTSVATVNAVYGVKL